MPIYAYKCSACGFAKDTLQKLSDPALTVCPSCGQDTYSKQVTAAGFQLKGSGWYVTDFRNNGSAPAASASKPSGEGGSAAPAAASGAPAAPASSGSSGTAATTSAAAPAASPAQPAATKPTPSA